jgi:N-acetylglutamate synthase-like GNAT family acetyltransferase
MHIREATPDDNNELQELQAKCPQGKTLIVSTVNTPDFFARVKAYESYKVYVACIDDHIIGSGTCVIRNAIVNGQIHRVGYLFQIFVNPEYRRKGVASELFRYREDYLTQQGAALAYALIMEGNIPSMRYVESQGFKLHRTLVMPALPVFKEMDVPSNGNIRPVRTEDLAKVAELLNETWRDHELYEPTSAQTLSQFIRRTPGYSYDNLLVLENQGEILSCMGFWDWNRIMRVTVEALSLKMRMIGFLLVTVRILPRFLKRGDTLKQVMLTPIGFKDPSYLRVLVRYLNNQARIQGIEQIFSICERGHALLRSLKGFIRVNTGMNLYIKPLQPNIRLSDKPVFVDGIDM